jgi:E3 ubiquitin-protein ligase RNF144
MELTSLPPATALLAVELQLADIQSIMQALNEGDQYTAFDAMRIEFQKLLLLFQDQVFAMDLLRADYDRRIVSDTLVREERQAEQDHNLACQLGGITPERRGQPTQAPEDHRKGKEPCRDNDSQDAYLASASTMMEDHTIMNLEGSAPIFSTYSLQRWNEVNTDSSNNIAESSTRNRSKGKGKASDNSYEDEHVTHTFCSACMEQCARFNTLELKCVRPGEVVQHAYCRSCLIDLLRTSLTDTTLFPPRCCGKRIPIAACIDLCPPDLIKQYMDKEVELESPNPVYCSNRYCAKFIKPESVTAEIAKCLGCGEETCTICKNPRHKGLCPEDPTVQMLMDVACEKSWQRCPKCRTMVELREGCYHMRWVLSVTQSN